MKLPTALLSAAAVAFGTAAAAVKSSAQGHQHLRSLSETCQQLPREQENSVMHTCVETLDDGSHNILYYVDGERTTPSCGCADEPIPKFLSQFHAVESEEYPGWTCYSKEVPTSDDHKGFLEIFNTVKQDNTYRCKARNCNPSPDDPINYSALVCAVGIDDGFNVFYQVACRMVDDPNDVEYKTEVKCGVSRIEREFKEEFLAVRPEKPTWKEWTCYSQTGFYDSIADESLFQGFREQLGIQSPDATCE